MLGAIIGDLTGAGGEFTDESVLTMAVADALLHGHHPRKALFLWGTRHPTCAYDPAFAKWLDT